MSIMPPRHESLHFFRAWVASPMRVASLVPSSRGLARLITREVSASTGPIIELGPGTGAFTQALLARGVAESDIALVESGGEFVHGLSARFPTAQVFHMDAARLKAVCPFGAGKAGAVISGLPLLSMSNRKIVAVLAGAFQQLREGGAFYQFTYGASCPVPRRVLDHLGLRAERVGSVLRNLPPASVYRIQRGADSSQRAARLRAPRP